MLQHVRFFPFKAGDTVPGLPYRLLARLGEGGFGQVWKVEHTTLRHICALTFCLDGEALRALRNEAKHIHRLQQEGLIEGFVAMREIYDDEDRRFPCIAYEFVKGEDFKKFLEKRFMFAGAFTPREAAEVIYELATIMARVHGRQDPLVHRDLKPANIMVLEGPSPWTFKIADFGLGVLAVDWLRALHLTLSDNGPEFCGAGTMAYMSFEQSGEKHQGHPSDDVHALGVMWYELLKGQFSDKFGWLLPPSRCYFFDWDKLRIDLCEIGLGAEETELVISCLGTHDVRPTNAGVLAAKLKDLYPDLPDKPSKAALVERLISNALSQIDFPYLDKFLNDEPATPDQRHTDPCVQFLAQAHADLDQLRTEHHAALQGAIADCNTAIQLAPHNSEAFRARGKIYETLGNYRQAVADYTEAIRLDPKSAKAYLNRADARCYLVSDDTDEDRTAIIYAQALADCCKAIKLNPMNPAAYRTRAEIFSYNGQLGNAIDDYNRTLALEPDDFIAEWNRKKLYAQLGDAERAEREREDQLDDGGG